MQSVAVWCLQDLQHQIEDIWVCFLHLIKEHQTWEQRPDTSCYQLLNIYPIYLYLNIYLNISTQCFLNSEAKVAGTLQAWHKTYDCVVHLCSSAAVRLSTDAICQLALLVVAHVAGRAADQLGHRVPLHEL